MSVNRVVEVFWGIVVVVGVGVNVVLVVSGAADDVVVSGFVESD